MPGPPVQEAAFMTEMGRVSSSMRARRSRSQPQRGLSGLQCVVHDPDQLGRERDEGNLVAQPAAEGLDGPHRVVAAPVEVPIHCGLDTSPDRTEDRG